MGAALSHLINHLQAALLASEAAKERLRQEELRQELERERIRNEIQAIWAEMRRDREEIGRRGLEGFEGWVKKSPMRTVLGR